MRREVSTLLIVVAFVCSAALTGVARGEDQQTKFQGTFAVVPLENPNFAEIERQSAAGAGLQVWKFTQAASRNRNIRYQGYMVGTDPFTTNQATVVNMPIIPVVFNIGGVIFDPTAPDFNCLGGNSALSLFQQSPLVNVPPNDYIMNGVDVGATQYVDAFQRANFWQPIQKNGGGYHVTLKPVLLPTIQLNAGQFGKLLNVGGCQTLGGINFNAWNAKLRVIIQALQKQGLVNPTNFPVFMTYNVVFGPYPSYCCILGFHSAFGNPATPQTYSTFEFDISGLFNKNGAGVLDTYIAAHEIGEWMDNPLGLPRNAPAWGHIGQVQGCQYNNEVGDPLTFKPSIKTRMPNGVTYDLQELAFFSWFYGAPSIGAGGLYSDNGTFVNDAGPLCK